MIKHLTGSLWFSLLCLINTEQKVFHFLSSTNWLRCAVNEDVHCSKLSRWSSKIKQHASLRLCSEAVDDMDEAQPACPHSFQKLCSLGSSENLLVFVTLLGFVSTLCPIQPASLPLQRVACTPVELSTYVWILRRSSICQQIVIVHRHLTSSRDSWKSAQTLLHLTRRSCVGVTFTPTECL